MTAQRVWQSRGRDPRKIKENILGAGGSAFEGRENSVVLGDGVCPYSRQGD